MFALWPGVPQRWIDDACSLQGTLLIQSCRLYPPLRVDDGGVEKTPHCAQRLTYSPSTTYLSFCLFTCLINLFRSLFFSRVTLDYTPSIPPSKGPMRNILSQYRNEAPLPAASSHLNPHHNLHLSLSYYSNFADRYLPELPTRCSQLGI